MVLFEKICSYYRGYTSVSIDVSETDQLLNIAYNSDITVLICKSPLKISPHKGATMTSLLSVYDYSLYSNRKQVFTRFSNYSTNST